MPASRDAFAQAAISQWNALVGDHVVRVPPVVGGRSIVDGSGGPLQAITRRTVPLWPYTQIRHARSLLQLVDDDAPIDSIPPLLTKYSRDEAFAARTSGDNLFVDDNAWVALAQWQQRVVSAPHAKTSARTHRLLDWLASQVDETGGVPWTDHGTSRHACSTGAVGAALALIADAGGHDGSRFDAPELADRCARFLGEVLLDGDGLVRDNIDERGVIEDTLWSYNQGMAVRLDAARHRHGRSDAMASARTRAEAGLARFSGDALWAQPVAFNAIWFRGLIALAALDRAMTPPIRAELDAYADRLAEWLASQPWFARTTIDGDPGRYAGGESPALDRAGAVQVLTLAALTDEQFGLVV